METVTSGGHAASTATTTATRRRRGAISRGDVLAAALELVDHEGLDALSMRRLAEQLGMEPMSLYKRVTGKDDLLSGIGELIWNEVAAAATPTDDWASWLRKLGHAVRAALHDHPNAISLLNGVDVFPPAMLEVLATQLEHTAPGAPTHADAVNAICTVTAFALGCAFAECSYCHAAGPENSTSAERRIVRALPPDTPDRLVDTALAVCGSDIDDTFTRGLDLIVRGCQPDKLLPS